MCLGGACDFCTLLPFWVWVGNLMYICILHYLWCFISCVHLCIIDCIVSYALKICFSYILWSPWYAGYELMMLLVMLMRCIAMLLVAVGSLYLWIAYYYKNAIYDPLLWVECLSCSNYALMAISSLICAWEPCSFHLESKTHLSSWMFSLHATLLRSLSFFFPQRHFMYHS
jgi:hypothetical protein